MAQPGSFAHLDDAAIRVVFDDMDHDKSGHLDVAEFKTGLRKLGIPVKSKEVLEIMAAGHDKFDPEKGMSFAAFRSFIHKREDQLIVIFKEIDVDGSGHIDLEEFSKAIQKYKPEIKKGEYRQMLKRLDKNNDALISYEEFREALLLLPSLEVASMFDHCNRTAIDLGESVTVPEDVRSAAEARKLLFGGTVAGVVSRTSTAPLDRVKVIMQTGEGKMSIMDSFKYIYTEGGVRGFWRGNGANVLKMGPEMGLRFWAFFQFKRYLAKDTKDPTIPERLLCGALAGMFSQTIVYPLETIKIRMTLALTGTYTGIGDCCRKLYGPEGIRGLFKGYVPAMIGVVPYCGVDLTLFSFFKEEYVRQYPDDTPGPVVLLTAGAIAQGCGQLVAYPLQVVRTRMQAQGTHGIPHYQGMMQCARSIIHRHGVLGFWQGVQANFLKTLPAVSVSRVAYGWAAEFF